MNQITDNVISTLKPKLSRFWNWLQPTFSCCGVSSPESYSAWEGVAGLPANWKVPDVCCDQETEEKGERRLMSGDFL